ncbi:MAG: NADP-dependent oxidoreductase [Brevibacterium sp.]
MRAVVLTAFGGPEMLHVEHVPIPAPGPGQVRVRTHAIGVNPMDGKIRSGASFFPVSLPTILGREFAGTIDAIGAGVVDTRIGDRVAGIADHEHGAYAEFTISSTYVHLPNTIAFDLAAAIPIAAGTASRVLRLLHMQAGETLLVNGASGSVGSMAIQLAVARGITVIGTGGPASQDAIAALGATPIIYGDGLVERVEATALGVDAAFDVAGKGTLPELIQLSGGPERVITIADDAAQEHGVIFSTGAGFDHDTDHIAEAVSGASDSTIEPRIARSFSLEQAEHAHRISDAGHPGGKVLLHP